MLEREIRREKTLEQRSKDGKSKQGVKVATSAFLMAIASVTSQQGALAVQAVQAQQTGIPSPSSPTSPSKKMFESLKEQLQAIQIKENATEKTDEPNKATCIEPSADMMPAIDNNGSQINLSVSQAVPTEPTVDQNLQTAEENFFETIDQVKEFSEIGEQENYNSIAFSGYSISSN